MAHAAARGRDIAGVARDDVELELRYCLAGCGAVVQAKIEHRELPHSLAALVQECLDEVRHDSMDGQPLRYRINSDGSFVLYSVGADGQDAGGNPLPSVSEKKPAE